MKKNILIILFATIVGAQGINSNINSYKTNVVLRPSENGVEVITFVEIFNRNLQFLKKDNYFESSYNLNISLISEDGSKIDEKSFSDTIVVENFSQTVSRVNPIQVITSFEIPLKEFSVNFSLKDLDTKLIGKKQKKFKKKNLPSGNFSKIFEPIFVKNKKGSWEFALDKYPISINNVEVKNNILEFYQYFVLDKGNYFLDNIDTSDLRVKIQVSQDGNVSSKSFPIGFRNDYLMLSSIKNVNAALEQMNYILNTEERKELRELKSSDKEKFFKKVWAKRDPDVTTKENELMIEYYKRVAFAEENFSRGTSGGWRSDMGMIYILFGRPDDISRSMNPQQSYNYETWYYFQINEEFRFVDDFGFGDYRLRTPFIY